MGWERREWGAGRETLAAGEAGAPAAPWAHGVNTIKLAELSRQICRSGGIISAVFLCLDLTGVHWVCNGKKTTSLI